MSVQATTWVWEHSQAEDTARLVLLAIADSANREGENAWVSAGTIAKMCRVGHRTAQRKIAELIDSGELEKMGSRGAKQANVYRLPGVANGGAVRHSSDVGDTSSVRHSSDVGDTSSVRHSSDVGDTSSVRHSSDVRQIGVYVTGDVVPTSRVTPRYVTGDVIPTSRVTYIPNNPINPSSSKELHPMNNARAREVIGTDQQRPVPGRIRYSPLFEQFWEIYPRKESKPEAHQAWLAATKLNNPSTVLAGAKRYAENPHRNPTYTKTPARWLNARGWEDGPAEPPRPPQPTKLPSWAERQRISELAGAEFLKNHYNQNPAEEQGDWIAGELA